VKGALILHLTNNDICPMGFSLPPPYNAILHSCNVATRGLKLPAATEIDIPWPSHSVSSLQSLQN